jgi:Family of unknown function (DUF6080)
MVADRNFKFVLLFSFIYCLLCYSLAIHWYEKGYFSVYDIFFDTDANTVLTSMSHGRGRHAITHAFLDLFSIPIRIIEMTCSNLFVVTDRREFRELLALSICPIFSSLTIVYFYRCLTLLNIKIFDANIITLIFAASFTNIIFSIVPETYAVSCFFISCLIFYFFNSEREKTSGSFVVWVALAVCLTGITVTNICIFFLVFMVHLLKNEQLSWLGAIKKACFYSLGVLFLIIFFYKFSYFILDMKEGHEGGAKWLSVYLTSSFWEFKWNIINLFGASINSFVSAYPAVIVLDNCGDFICNKLSFTRDKSDFLLLACVAIIWGAVAFFSRKFVFEKKWQNLYLVCGLIIAFNFTLHALFGREMFMYTQHWITPLLILLVPIIQNKRFISISFLLLLVIMNVNFLFNVEQLVALK